MSKTLSKTPTGKRCKWTDEELQTLRHYYPLHPRSWDGWADVLPGTTVSQRYRKARQLGIRHECSTRWSADELAALDENYESRGAVWEGWADLLDGKTPTQIRAKANARRLKVYQKWTPAKKRLVLERALQMQDEVGIPADACCAMAYKEFYNYKRRSR